MDEDPRFDNYLQLQAGSPCIDAADGDAATATDLLGNQRYDDPDMSNIGIGNPDYVDMGACEYQGTVTTPITHTLSVYSSGATGVSISSSTGHGGTTNYTKTVNDGTSVALTAPILSGKTFTGWTGSVSSSNRTISLSMNANKTVTANYQAATTTYSLNVYASGASSVSISSSTGHGGTTDYIKTVNEGTTVNLTAPVLSGKNFTGWTGSVSSGSRTISFTMNAGKFVTANYETASPTLSSISISGVTQVNESSGAQYTATAYYSDGSSANVTSSASWSENSSYASISSSGYLSTASVSSDQSCTITATYGGKSDTHSVTIKNATSTTTYPLYVYSGGVSNVSISSSTGHSGTTYYSKTVNEGTTVSLTAPITSGDMTFTGWTGAVTSNNQTISLTMNASQYVVANYEAGTTPTSYTLSVSSNGASSVAISSSTGQSGTTNYTKTVNDGTSVALTAPATSGGATFTGWTGAVTSSSQTISLSMNANKTVTANYQEGSTPTLSSISISGSTQVDESSGAQYTATAYYSDCTITASYGGKSDTHSVTIKNVAATLSYITISGLTQVDENSGAQYTCTAYYSDGSTANVTNSASWSENSSYASISSSGYLTTSSVSSDQSCTVTASYGGKSDTQSVTIKNGVTAPAPPAAPSGLSATAVATTRINLSWSDNASNETGFKIERSIRNNRSFAQIATVSQNTTSYSDTTVRKGTTYYYRVRATNTAGDSAYSNEANATTPKK
jgi:uncharacterized protein YdbL (DUF1318 family)